MKYISQFAIGSSVVPNGDATQTSLTSQVFETESCQYFSIQTTTLGATITGTVQVQVSNDPVAQASQVVNWSSPTGAYTQSVTGATAAGASLSSSMTDFCWKWARVVYTKTTSAAGALISISVKSDGY
jgi:hypothetical protein